MRIGVVIGRIGGIDGVALETEKCITVLKSLGHEVCIITGELETPMTNVTMLPELSFSHPLCEAAQRDAFLEQQADEEEFVKRLKKEASYIALQLEKWISDEKIEVLFTQNALALPCHLQMGMALRDVIEKTAIPTVAHNHDFYWERGDRYNTSYPLIENIKKECFPPILPSIKQAVINSYSKNQLKSKFNVDSVILPNVMDFNKPFAEFDDYNSDLPHALGFTDDDIPLFQITRIVSRKGIETAISLVERLKDKRVKLYITGYDKDLGQVYSAGLKEQVQRLHLEKQVFFVSHLFDNVRKMDGEQKIYSLADAYAYCRATTYFSTYEGFGNAFVESVIAKRPVFVNNYIPVYWPDIGSKGFKTVQIENGELTDEAVKAISRIINSKDECEEIGEYNYALGKEHFSYEVLKELLAKLFTF